MKRNADLTTPFFLVATPQLADPHFAKAVVLIVEHEEAGSLGFIVNRPIGIKLSDLVGPRDYPIPPEITGWYGGPVKTDTGVVMSAAEEDSPGKGVTLSSAERALRRLVDAQALRLTSLRTGGATSRDGEPLYGYRFLVGYAGWGAGQMERELKEGAWIQVPFNRDLLFDTSWKTLWERSLLGVGVNPRSLVAPPQPYLS